MMLDLDVHREILEALERAPGVNAADIGVAVKDGVVMLSGLVGSYIEKDEATNVALRAAGVRAVASEIRVCDPETGATTDTAIARAAVRSLSDAPQIPQARIRVKVSQGWVTFRGEVETWEQARDAAALVRQLPGVQGVLNLLALKGEHRARVSAPVRGPVRSGSASEGVQRRGNHSKGARPSRDPAMPLPTS